MHVVPGHVDLLGKLLPNGGNVLVVSGPGKLLALRERVEGFKEIIENKYPKLKIVHTLNDIESNKSSYQQTIEFLKSQDSFPIVKRGDFYFYWLFYLNLFKIILLYYRMLKLDFEISSVKY